MNRYEVIFIIDPNVESEDVERVIENVQDLISSSGGGITKVDNWGKKRLAYEVKGNRDGNYVLIDFEGDPELIQSLGRYYALSEEIIKYMTVRAGKLTEPRRKADEDEEDFYDRFEVDDEDEEE